MKKKNNAKRFIALGYLMIAAGTWAMVSCVIGGRLSAEESLPLPFGFITVATGAMLLTRTKIAVFFLFLYGATLLILNIVHEGVTQPYNLIWVALIAVCLPLAKIAKK